MPINYSLYPPDWQARRIRILSRARYRCEHCGVVAGSVIERRPRKAWPAQVQTYYVVIELQVAHLDRDPENWSVRDERLVALCQRCHLNYDRRDNLRRRRLREAQEMGLQPLFDY